MLNKPKFMSPSTSLQDCAVDINGNEMMFSCVVDGNEPIYAWRIRIYSIVDNVLVFDSDRQNCPPFYPVDEKNRSVVFPVDLKEYLVSPYMIQDSDNKPLFVNRSEPYYWTIEFWNKSDSEKEKEQLPSGATDYVATTKSCEEAFYANSIPEISLYYKSKSDNEYTLFSIDGTDDIIFNQSSYEFKATYKQEEDIALKRYGWRVTDIKSGQVLHDTITNNQVYGTSENILLSYEGLLNNGSYYLELYIETQNNIAFTMTFQPFSVSYPTTFLTNDFETEFLPKEAAVINSWEDAKTIEGGTNFESVSCVSCYPIVEKDTMSINIRDGERITYDYGSTANMDIGEDTYIVLSMQLLGKEDTTLFLAEGIDDSGNIITRRLSFEDGQFCYTINCSGRYELSAYHTPSEGYEPCEYVWYTITMAPYSGESLLSVVESKTINGLYPSDNLYPSDENISPLYPSFGEWQTKISEVGEG